MCRDIAFAFVALDTCRLYNNPTEPEPPISPRKPILHRKRLQLRPPRRTQHPVYRLDLLDAGVVHDPAGFRRGFTARRSTPTPPGPAAAAGPAGRTYSKGVTEQARPANSRDLRRSVSWGELHSDFAQPTYESVVGQLAMASGSAMSLYAHEAATVVASGGRQSCSRRYCVQVAR